MNLPGLQWTGPFPDTFARVLTPEAIAFVAGLARRYHWELELLLARRETRQQDWDRGVPPGPQAGSGSHGERAWTVAALPGGLAGGRPIPTRHDFEDGLAPTPENLLAAQAGLVDGVPAEPELLRVRPRGLHLTEAHLRVDGLPVPACLFDAGLFLFHRAAALAAAGRVPCLDLPKLEHHLEARWWNRVLGSAEKALGLPAGAIKVTVAIETLPAAFQLDELLFELRERALALELDPVDYAFSWLKVRQGDASASLPDRARIDLDQPFLRACMQRMAQSCRRRGCLALVDGRPLALDGTIAGDGDLLAAPAGNRSDAGLRASLRDGIRYLEAWLGGTGRLPIVAATLELATAELARMQLWHWVRHEVPVEGHGPLDRALFHRFVTEALHQIRAEIGARSLEEGLYLEAAELFEDLVLAPTPEPFLAHSAYPRLTERHPLGETA